MSNAKVYVIHENIEWTQHLVKWLEKIQVPYELWDLSSGILDLQSPPPQGIFIIGCPHLLIREGIAMHQSSRSRCLLG